MDDVQEVMGSELEVTPTEKLAEEDRMAIEAAKNQIRLAVSNAKLALAEQEKADLSYKLVVMQVFMKYGLSSKDSVSEDGSIVRNK